MSAVFEIEIRLPSTLYRGWCGKKRPKKLKLHIPDPKNSLTLCSLRISSPHYHKECVESHEADLNNDLCVICLSRCLSRQRKIGNGSIPGGYYDQN